MKLSKTLMLAAALVMSANPSRVPPGGGSTVISAAVLDAAGNRDNSAVEKEGLLVWGHGSRGLLRFGA